MTPVVGGCSVETLGDGGATINWISGDGGYNWTNKRKYVINRPRIYKEKQHSAGNTDLCR